MEVVLIEEEGINYQGRSVSIRRGGHFPAVAILFGGNQASETINR